MLKLRSQINDKYKWNLSRLYKNDLAWEKDLKKLDTLCSQLLKYKGKIQSDKLLEFLINYEKYSRLHENLLVYSYLNFSTDTSSQSARDREQRLEMKSAQLASKLVFIDQELSRLSKKKFKKLKAKQPKLENYNYFIEQYTRFEPYLLSEESEKVISALSPVLSKPENIFETLTDTNFVFPEITHKGKKIVVSHGSAMKLLESKDRSLREKVHNAYYQPYFQYKDAIAAAYDGVIQSLNIKSKLRGFTSGRDMVLFGEELNQDVIQALLKAVHQNLDVSYEYKKIRAKKLGLKKLMPYDLAAPLNDVKFEYSYEQIIKNTRNALQPLGNKYLKKFDNSINSKAVDVFENKFKRSGAYSWGSYQSGGYVFLNTSGKSRDISTFAHEMGHCLHRDFSIEHQSYFYYNNPIVLAEVASTVNEIFLYEYLLKNEKNKNKREAIIQNYVTLFEATFFRQSMFADFENQVHQLAGKGQAFTEKTFTSIYEKLLEKYHGPNLILDELKKIEWARIPHFYRPFYVFKYATSIGVAMNFAQSILREEDGAVDNYIKFLSAGSHKPPLEILKTSGLDLTDPRIYSPLFKRYRELLKLI